jgi:CRP-like cAMP-binding protein
MSMVVSDAHVCACSHSINAHALSRAAGCAFCGCRGFTEPEQRASAGVALGSYAAAAFELLSKGAALGHLADEALVALVKDGRGRMFGDGHMLVRSGERSPLLHVVLDGRLLIEGADHTHTVSPGEPAGDLGAFVGEPRLASVSGHGAGLALEMDLVRLQPTFAAHPDLFESLLHLLARFSGTTDDLVRTMVNAAFAQQAAVTAGTARA